MPKETITAILRTAFGSSLKGVVAVSPKKPPN